MTAFPCQVHDAELWFPQAGPATKAKQLCAGCPNRVACLAEAVEGDILEGIWGGTSPKERRLLSPASLAREIPKVRQRARKAARTCSLTGCGRKHHSGGLCNAHVLRARREVA